ncbi:collagen binding domain-containing protein [Cohnella herbarum]|uniref:Cadherin-like domain-containing protein n=1 Tax=Cohnella herbarum TaxID=2728023 RepID=A0A7Z2VFP6_9BACL|nr:SpaA isopeptide-forming pilin-related protein [Cohnella herbarum]QJD82346.1 cadherin-like domain-containing protein [Cohnella herbarum]
MRVTRARMSKARVRQAKQKLAIFVAVALFLQLVTQLFVAPGSYAAGKQIEDDQHLITSVKMYDEEPTFTGAVMNLNGNSLVLPNRPDVNNFVAAIYDWELPDNHDYSDGDTYTFSLPNVFNIQSPITGNLTGGVGTFVVTTAGTVTFTFNDSINGQQGIEGNFYVWLKFDKSKLDGGLEQKIDFSSVHKADIDIKFANKAKDGLEKTGKASKGGFNSDVIDWTVEFNQAENTINNAVLNDTLPTGLTLQGNINICELEVQLDGTVELNSLKPCTTAPSFPINLGNIDKAFRVTYQTSVPAPTTAPFTGIQYTNNAVLTGTGMTSQSKNATATISFNEPLNKKDTAYDSEKQRITWQIQYNYNQQAIAAADALILDKFATTNTVDQKVVSVTMAVYEVAIDSSGQGTRGALVDPSQYTLTSIGTDYDEGFSLKFHDPVTKAYDIVYQTEAQQRIYDDVTVTNTVYGGGITKEDDADYKEVIFDKKVSKENFQAKTIEWEITVNQDLKTMTDIVIADNYLDMHMELLPATVKINGVDIASTDFLLAADPDYKTGFKISLKPGKSISTKQVITFTTLFDPKAGKPLEDKYKNTATINWKENNVAQTPITKSATVTPQNFTLENGFKKGEYSAKDKTITWTIYVNYNLHTVNPAIISDKYTGNQKFVDGSLEVKHLTLNPGNNSITEGLSVSIPNGKFTLDAINQSFVLDLGPINSAYQIQYKTSLGDNSPIAGNYSNDAKMQNGVGGPILFKMSATVTPKHGGQYVQKSGSQVGNTDIAKWKVTINPSQSYIAAGSVLTDTLSATTDNQFLLTDTLKLYETNLPADNSGNIPKGNPVAASDYTLAVTGNTFTLTFKNDVKTAYILEYDSYINANSGERLTNDLKYQGQSVSVVGQGNQQGILVSLAGAGGGASNGRDKLKIIKVDDLNRPLPGVKFELWNATGLTLLETLITDANGEASTSRKYKLHDTDGFPYKLKEISAPSGYILDPDYAAGKIIDFKGAPFNITNKIIRQGFELVKVDSVDPSKKLKDAVFELRDSGNALIATLTTDNDGRIAYGDMAAGNYTLVEIAAPLFYKLDPTPISVPIVANQTQIVALTQPNTLGSGASLVITKVNAKDHSDLLKGIDFELRNAANVVVDTGTTDVNGTLEFENLAYGLYTLVETKADGFVIEVPETKVSIHQPTTPLIIENKENDRSVQLTKFNSNKSLVLSGAVFELRAETLLLDLQGNPIYEVVPGIDVAKLTTDVNGQLILKDLPPNKYQLVEIQAPYDYRLDQTPVAFEITKTQTTAVLVEKTNERQSSGGVWTPEPTPTPTPKPTPSPEPTPTPTSGPTTSPEPTPTPVPTIDPEKPVHPPKIEEKTTNEKPVKGDVDVPKGGKVEVGEKPKHGTVKVTPDGKWKYTPDKDYKGKDSFTIIVTDKDGNEEEILVDIDVDDVPRGGVDPDGKAPGKTLPKTGESSSLPLQLAGLALVAMGVVLLNRKRIFRIKRE